MFLISLLVILSGIYCVWLYERYNNVWKHIAKFPGPIAVPIFGNVLQIGFKPDEYLTAMCRWFSEYNFEIHRIYAGSQPYVIIADPKDIEALLSSNTFTFKADIYDFLRPWLGDGLLTSNGQQWLKHRKMITPSFHFQILQDFLAIINETTDRFMLLLDTFAANEEIIDFQAIVTRSTIDVICESAMGIQVNAIAGQSSAMVDAMNSICYVIQERVFSALKRFDIYFRFSKEGRMQKEAIQIMRMEFSKIIEKRREILKHNNNNANKSSEVVGKRRKMAFLDNLLTAELDGRPLTFQDTFEEVSTFMFEGHDTTASAITFAIFCLSRHAHVQQLAFEEQYAMFGDDTQSSPSYQQLQEMKYLEVVIKEALRLFPSVPIIGRTARESTEIGGHFIPKGTTVLVPIIGAGVNPRIFAEPYSFRPERFESREQRADGNPFAYVPFSAGPRNCIGQKFAMMELKVTISKILRNFHILPPIAGLSTGIIDPCDRHVKPHKTYDLQLAALVTLKSMNGVHVRLKRRAY